MIHLQNVLKISLHNVLKMSWRRVCNQQKQPLTNILEKVILETLPIFKGAHPFYSKFTSQLDLKRNSSTCVFIWALWYFSKLFGEYHLGECLKIRLQEIRLKRYFVDFQWWVILTSRVTWKMLIARYAVIFNSKHSCFALSVSLKK